MRGAEIWEWLNTLVEVVDTNQQLIEVTCETMNIDWPELPQKEISELREFVDIESNNIMLEQAINELSALSDLISRGKNRPRPRVHPKKLHNLEKMTALTGLKRKCRKKIYKARKTPIIITVKETKK